MRVARSSAEIRTGGRIAVLNVTDMARRGLATAGIVQGLAVFSVPHTTCGLVVNEDEPGLRDDLGRLIAELAESVKPADGFHHDRIDNNASAHLTASLLGHSVTLAVADGNLTLGTWQSLLLLEADGPRQRRLDMVFLGL